MVAHDKERDAMKILAAAAGSLMLSGLLYALGAALVGRVMVTKDVLGETFGAFARRCHLAAAGPFALGLFAALVSAMIWSFVR